MRIAAALLISLIATSAHAADNAAQLESAKRLSQLMVHFQENSAKLAHSPRARPTP